MKKYDINRLYIITTNKNEIRFICKYDNRKDIYTEIFTGDKIKRESVLNVEPLYNYYSILERYNYTTHEPLRINKKGLLYDFIRVNDKKYIDDNTMNKKLTINKK